MSKQSANRSYKKGQSKNKSANNGDSRPGQAKATTKPVETTTKANGTVAAKSVEATTKSNATVAAKSAEAAKKSNATVAAKPLEATMKANGTTAAKPVEATTKGGATAPAKSAPATSRAGVATTTKQTSKQQRKQHKVQSRLEQQRIDTRNRRITIYSLMAAVVLVGGLIAFIVINNSLAANTLTQAETVVDPNYQPVDGVYCDSLEQLSYHIHVHLAIYIDGATVPVSQAIGIAPIGVATSGAQPTCYYWIHTHDTTGIVHIESPTTRLYSLKQFFDIWETFGSSSINYPTQLSSSTGWTIYVAGKKVNSDFAHLQMTPHEVITIVYNSPNIKPDKTYSFPSGY